MDHHTLHYLEVSNREPDLIQLVKRYCKEQGLFRTDGVSIPTFSELVELDLATVEPSLAGPKRLQDRVSSSRVRSVFAATFRAEEQEQPPNGDARQETQVSSRERPALDFTAAAPAADRDAPGTRLRDGDVVVAAITSCTNTSNPSVMVAPGLLAQRAVEAGLRVAPHVKTSLAPGSRVVTDYLRRAKLLPYAAGVQHLWHASRQLRGSRA